MRKNKLPLTSEKISYIARGDFFTIATTFLSDNGALQIKKSQIVRTSRFNTKDFQEYLDLEFEDSKILFAKEVDHRKFKDEYICREQEFAEDSFSILGEVLAVDNFLYLNIDFDKINIWSFQNKTLENIEKKINEGASHLNNINNSRFDAFIHIDTPKSNGLEDQILKLLEEKKLEDYELLIIGGEYIWGNNLVCFLEKIFNLKQVQKLKVILDNMAIFEGLLSKGGFQTKLKYLHKEMFAPALFHIGKLPKDNKIELKSPKGTRQILLEENCLNIVKYNPKERAEFAGLAEKGGLLFVGKGSMDISKCKLPNPDKEQLLRQDYLVDFVEEKEDFEYVNKQRRGIKIFDYTLKRTVKDIGLDVIEGEFVKKGTGICKYKQLGALVERRVRSPIEGQVDLSHVNAGYIFINSRDKKKSKLKAHSYVRIRPRMIIGQRVEGLLDENIKYVSSLTKKNYENFVQKGIEAIICRSIEKGLFLDIEEFSLDKLVSVVILEGIDIKVGKGFLLDSFGQFNVVIDEKDLVVKIGLPKKVGNFYEDFWKKEFGNQKEYRIDEQVKLIHEEYWGEYAEVTSKKGKKLKLRHGGGVLESDIVNLM